MDDDLGLDEDLDGHGGGKLAVAAVLALELRACLKVDENMNTLSLTKLDVLHSKVELKMAA